MSLVVCFQCQCTNVDAQTVIVFSMRFFFVSVYLSHSLTHSTVRSFIYKFPHRVSKQRVFKYVCIIVAASAMSITKNKLDKKV